MSVCSFRCFACHVILNARCMLCFFVCFNFLVLYILLQFYEVSSSFIDATKQYLGVFFSFLMKSFSKFSLLSRTFFEDTYAVAKLQAQSLDASILGDCQIAGIASIFNSSLSVLFTMAFNCNLPAFKNSSSAFILLFQLNLKSFQIRVFL